MLFKSSNSFEHYNDLFGKNNEEISLPSIFIPRTDHNIKVFLKKNASKYLYFSLPNLEIKEENQLKDESIPWVNRASISEDISKISPYKQEKNNNINIALDESEDIPLITESLNNNTLNKYYTDVIVNSVFDIKNAIKPKKVFLVLYPRKISLFKESKIDLDLFESKEEIKLISNKRRRNKEDDIRRMIGRRFFNDILLKLINNILEKAGSLIIFEKIQQDAIYDLVKKCNKKMLNMTLEQIFTNKEIYRGNNMDKFKHNLKLVNLLKSDDYKDIREKTQIDKILDVKYFDLFKDYLTSNEFIEEINRLKSNKKFDKSYVTNYIHYSLHFIENFLD